MQLKTAQTKAELEQILQLQQANHYDNISSHTKDQEGFVTVLHDLELLMRMNEAAGQIIAIDEAKVVAYALVMLNSFSQEIPVLEPMFEVFKTVDYRGKKLTDFTFYVMGQICIDKSYRGKGVFGQLYEKHKEIYSEQFQLCITEVSKNNVRSIRAHEKVGFKTIYTYRDQTDHWLIMAWDWS